MQRGGELVKEPSRCFTGIRYASVLYGESATTDLLVLYTIPARYRSDQKIGATP